MEISFLLKMEQKSWQKQSSHLGKINSVRSVLHMMISLHQALSRLEQS